MINFEALYKLTYGIYLISSGNKSRGNGFISNTFFQVTSEPPRFASCCNKDNYTAEVIQKSGAYAVSVIPQDIPADIISRFGYKSGRDFDKLEGMELAYGETGVPIVLNEAIAYLECRVIQTIDVGTHLMFIGELVQAELLDNTREPLTYLYYRQVRKAFAPKNAPTYIDKSKLESTEPKIKAARYQCTACGYIYDDAVEEIKFADLPDDWTCPNCGTAKEDFIEI
ncbi:MAG: flavin reductase [Bacteroidota bacterium]|nr:flavin reductase [Bacteroidota bacterium]